MLDLNYICNANHYNMQERFKQLLEEKKLTATRFAALIKVNASAMSHILNGRSKPGFDVLDKIAQAFPDVNLNWLISGKGTIYNHQLPPVELPEDVQRMEMESGKEKEEPVVLPENTETTATASVQVPSAPLAATITASKKIKRIVFFFEDGSFEDYEK